MQYNLMVVHEDNTTLCYHATVEQHVVLLFRYTKPKGQLPDYNAPVVLKLDRRSVEDFCNKLHRNIIKEFKQ